MTRRSTVSGIRFATALLLLALGCDPKDSDYFFEDDGPPTGILQGLIRAGATPLASVPVEIAGAGSHSTMTDGLGMYRFTDLALGQYTVRATPPTHDCPAATATVQAFQTTTVDLLCTPKVGTLDGTVRLDLNPRAGVLITASQGSTPVATATTGSNGRYMMSLGPGTYTAIMTAIVGAICPVTQRSVVIQSTQTTSADFDCVSPGSVSGLVRFNGNGVSGRNVTLSQGGSTVATATTAAGGTYSIVGIAPGSYTASVTPLAGESCTAPMTFSVQSNQTVTANFDCVGMVDFSVALGEPPASYRHLGTTSETCTGITTSPARPGGIWSTAWSGPATIGTTERTGILDSNGKAVDRQPISDFGTYGVTVMVSAGGVTRSASGSVNVTSAAGTCPP